MKVMNDGLYFTVLEKGVHGQCAVTVVMGKTHTACNVLDNIFDLFGLYMKMLYLTTGHAESCPVKPVSQSPSLKPGDLDKSQFKSSSL